MNSTFVLRKLAAITIHFHKCGNLVVVLRQVWVRGSIRKEEEMRGGDFGFGNNLGKWRTGEPFRDSISFPTRARIRPSQVSTLHFADFSKQKHKCGRVYFLFAYFFLRTLPCMRVFSSHVLGEKRNFSRHWKWNWAPFFPLFLPRVYLDYFSFLVFLVFFLCLPHRSSANMGTRVWRRNGENPVRTGLPGDEAPQLKAVPNSIIPGKK